MIWFNREYWKGRRKARALRTMREEMTRLYPALADMTPEEFERRALSGVSKLATVSKKASLTVEEAGKVFTSFGAAHAQRLKKPAPL